MQALRHGARQALRSSVIREPCIASARACSTDVPTGRINLSKAERQQLASQFIEKFKAANNGQLPSVTLLRREVGGGYYVLKEVVQLFEKSSQDNDASENDADLKKSKTQKSDITKQDKQLVDDVPQKSATATKEGRKKKSNQSEKEEVTEASALEGEHHEQLRKVSDESEKEKSKRQLSSKNDKSPVQNKKTTSQRVKPLEERKPVKQTNDKMISASAEKLNESPMETDDTFESLMDTISTDEDNDDDSDVAAPEYQQTLMMQIKEGRSQPLAVDLNAKSMAHGKKDDHSMRSGLQLKENGDMETMQKGLSAVKGMIQSMAKPSPDVTQSKQSTDFAQSKPSSDMSFGPLSKAPTTVLRIVNVPVHISAHQLKSTCETIAKVHAVSMRRGRIADVHFDVDLREINNVLERLRKVVLGSTPLKVFPALRFSCEPSTSSRFIPRNVQELKHMRNSLIHAFEHRFKFLCFQVQDFHELHNLKAAR